MEAVYPICCSVDVHKKFFGALLLLSVANRFELVP